MKVLYVIDTIQGSGSERSVVDIALHLKNVTPVFVHIYKGDMLKPLLEEAGIKVYSLDISGPRNFSKAANELKKVYEKEKPDIVHSTLFRSDCIVRKLRNKYSIPVINSFVSDSYGKFRLKNHPPLLKLKMRLVQLYDIYTSRKVDFFISNSEAIKNSKGKSTMVNLDKIKMIPRGRDVEKYKGELDQAELEELRKSLNVENKHVLLSVGRLIETKGQVDIVNAMPKILEENPDAVLLLAGHGICKTKLENRARELGLQDHVQLLGRRMDVPNLLAIADVFVFPTYSEGLPGALIEAMLAKKIIVCTNIPENKECVNENTALFFPRGDQQKLAEQVNYALKHKDELKAKGNEARKIAMDKFDIVKVAERYEETYNQLLKKFNNVATQVQ